PFAKQPSPELPPAPKAPPPLPSDPPPLPKAALDLPPEPPVPVVKPPAVPAEKTEKSVDKPQDFLVPGVDKAPAPPIGLPPAPPPVESPKPQAGTDTKPTTSNASGSYKLHVRMGGNLGPRFEVRDGDALLLKVYCEHIEMQGHHDAGAIPGVSAS